MQLFDSALCIRCKGKGLCGKPCIIYSKVKGFLPKTKTHFSGSSPPEIFVGRYNYPNIGAGILTPDSSDIENTTDSSPNRGEREELDRSWTNQSRGGRSGARMAGEKSESNFVDSLDTTSLSSPELWHEKRLSIEEILKNRGQLVYGRFSTEIKKAKTNNKLLTVMQEVSMAYRPVSTEFFLKRPPKQTVEMNIHSPIIGNPAPLQLARLEENTKVLPKVDYLVSDTDAKSKNSILELYRSSVQITNINKILSAGLLGLKAQRKLVPTRWSITAVDDTISKQLLSNIRYYPEISEIQLFNSEYNGNHYEIFLLPDKFSFEVLEAEMRGSLWNQSGIVAMMQDYELFHGRKEYANEVTGAYYANRLGLCEYLEKVKRQATAIFFREVRPEYYAPLGVGILREITREAFKHRPEKFSDINQALKQAQTRLINPVSLWTEKSALLKEFGKQKRLNQWF